MSQVLEQELRQILATIAPDTDTSALAADADLREELDIDSMDFLNFVIALNKRYGVEIPELDYPKLATLTECASYLSHHVSGYRQAAGS